MAKKVTVLENGPCLIEGAVTYTDADGNEQKSPGNAVALCRCGQSANKPFCDGAHKKVGFQAAGIELVLE